MDEGTLMAAARPRAARVRVPMDQLIHDLNRFGQHLASCAAWGGNPAKLQLAPRLPERCNCGLWQALERANS